MEWWHEIWPLMEWCLHRSCLIWVSAFGMNKFRRRVICEILARRTDEPSPKLQERRRSQPKEAFSRHTIRMLTIVNFTRESDKLMMISFRIKPPYCHSANINFQSFLCTMLIADWQKLNIIYISSKPVQWILTALRRFSFLPQKSQAGVKMSVLSKVEKVVQRCIFQRVIVLHNSSSCLSSPINAITRHICVS